MMRLFRRRILESTTMRKGLLVFCFFGVALALADLGSAEVLEHGSYIRFVSTETQQSGHAASRIVVDDDSKLAERQLLVESPAGSRVSIRLVYDPEIGGYSVSWEDLDSGWTAETASGYEDLPVDLAPIPESDWVDVTFELIAEHPDTKHFFEFRCCQGVKAVATREVASQVVGAETKDQISEVDELKDQVTTQLDGLNPPASFVDGFQFVRTRVLPSAAALEAESLVPEALVEVLDYVLEQTSPTGRSGEPRGERRYDQESEWTLEQSAASTGDYDLSTAAWLADRFGLSGDEESQEAPATEN